MSRPSLDKVMLGCAHLLALRGTCRKRQVGCVLIDINGHILSTGYNGTAAGLSHCIDVPCGGVGKPNGSDSCQGIHAELNALLRCADVSKIYTTYVTVLPCNNCMKTLLNTGCKRIVYAEGHENEQNVLSEWTKTGRSVLHLDGKGPGDAFKCGQN